MLPPVDMTAESGASFHSCTANSELFAMLCFVFQHPCNVKQAQIAVVLCHTRAVHFVMCLLCANCWCMHFRCAEEKIADLGSGPAHMIILTSLPSPTSALPIVLRLSLLLPCLPHNKAYHPLSI